jgi:hypothetical protein
MVKNNKENEYFRRLDYIISVDGCKWDAANPQTSKDCGRKDERTHHKRCHTPLLCMMLFCLVPRKKKMARISRTLREKINIVVQHF